MLGKEGDGVKGGGRGGRMRVIKSEVERERPREGENE